MKLHKREHTTDLCVDRRKLLHQRIVCLSPKVGSFQCFPPFLFQFFLLHIINLLLHFLCQVVKKDLKKVSELCSFFLLFFVEVIQPMMLVNDTTTTKIIVQTTIECARFCKFQLWTTEYSTHFSNLINIRQMSWQTHNLNHGKTIHSKEYLISLNLFKKL